MQLICESGKLEDYLYELDDVNFSHEMIKEKTEELFTTTHTEIEKTKIAFEFVRDEIAHSWDIQGTQVTCKASDVLTYGEGICYAKANLLAALLRSQRIPTGFCYQRLMLFDTPEKGYSLHALNAVYLTSLEKWIRLDARGNKEGVDAQFSIDQEKLAFTVNETFDEKNYPVIYTNPNIKTLAVLKENYDAFELYTKHLPEDI